MNTYLCFVYDIAVCRDTCYTIQASCERLARFGVFSILNGDINCGTVCSGRYEITGILKI